MARCWSARRRATSTCSTPSAPSARSSGRWAGRKGPLGDREYTPQEISAMILRSLKEIAEARTRPAGPQGRDHRAGLLLRRAAPGHARGGEIAGLERRPDHQRADGGGAGLRGSGSTSGKRSLVYDLGGGTFDVSVVRIQEGVVEVHAPATATTSWAATISTPSWSGISSIISGIQAGCRSLRRPAGDGPHHAGGGRREEAAVGGPFLHRSRRNTWTEADGKPVHLSMESTATSMRI